jgi:hypothetical protein
MRRPKRLFLFAIVILVLLALGPYPVRTSTKMGMNMSELPKEIFQNWVHSYEDDTGDIKVYRTSNYAFPPARGRAGMQFKPDGTFTDWDIAPADGHQSISGHWRIERPGHVHITFDDKSRPPWVLEILSIDTEMLKVRRHPVSP